jgi:hypothetical protein
MKGFSMMKKLVVVVALVGLGAGAGGCGTQRVAVRAAAMPEKPDALIQMQRGGCATEACQVYALSLFADGTVIYDGRANVTTLGQRQAKLSPAQVNQLVSAFDAMNFLDSDDRCCVCPNGVASQPVIIDYRRPGSPQKTVLHDQACSSAPPAMGALERAIDEATDVQRWTMPALARQVPEGSEPARAIPLGISVIAAVAAAPDFGTLTPAQSAGADPVAAPPTKPMTDLEGSDAVPPRSAESNDSVASEPAHP